MVEDYARELEIERFGISRGSASSVGTSDKKKD
jgi:hypothetical protein